MIESLVITLREGLEAALVLGIILAYINKLGRKELKQSVYYGLGAAIVASILGAVIFSLAGIDADNEIFEGTMYFVAGIFVATMVIWMWKTSKNLKSEMEEKLNNIVANKDSEGHKSQKWSIFGFTFIMVFREGIETVLFLTALTQKTNIALSYLGALIGLALTVLFAIFFIRGSLKINLQRFFRVTGIILLILVVRLFAGGFHEFGEREFIPLTPTIMAILGYIVRDSSTQLISMMLLTLPIIMVLMDVKSSAEKEDKQFSNNVEKRKYEAEILKVKRWKYIVISVAVIINLILGADLVVAMTKPVYDPKPEPVNAVSGQIMVPATELKENVLKKYSYEVNGVKIRFILIKRTDGSIGSGLDACQICGPKGYLQNENDKDNIICKNCNAPISIPTIGMPGGCNPVSLDGKVVGDKVNIKVSDLVAYEKNFAKASR